MYICQALNNTYVYGYALFGETALSVSGHVIVVVEPLSLTVFQL